MNNIHSSHCIYNVRHQGSASLFVSLYLVILAFFILLVSISQVKEERRKQAIGSLQKTFVKGVNGTSMNLIHEVGTEQYSKIPPTFGKIAKLTSEPIKITDVEIVQEGNLMRLIFTKKSFFEDNTGELRASKSMFIDLLGKELSINPPGVEVDLEIVVPAKKISETSNAKNNISISRAGNVARQLKYAGVDPTNIFIKADMRKSDEDDRFFTLNFIERSAFDKSFP